MIDKTPQATAVSQPQVNNAAPVGPAAWRPDDDVGLALNTNPFEKFDHTGKSFPGDADVNSRTNIRDATVDTAPLQGSKDQSDDDHLG